VLKKLNWTPARSAKTLLASLAGLAIAAPALAGNIYSWRTEAGDIAFTDEIKNVPERYRDQVVTRKTEGLSDYARFSAQDADEANSYAEQLQARLNYLQAINRTAPPVEQPQAFGTATIEFGSGDQRLTLNGAAGDDPVIVEELRVRRAGQIATRHDTVVRQGGRTLAIMRGKQGAETGAPNNILDEKNVELYH